MYSKLPPEDEEFVYSKHVEDLIGLNLKRKCISLLLIMRILNVIGSFLGMDSYYVDDRRLILLVSST